MEVMAKWETIFSTGLKEMLPALEWISLPGGMEGNIFVSSDATTNVFAAIDWSNGLVFREQSNLVRSWAEMALSPQEANGDGYSPWGDAVVRGLCVRRV